MLPSYSGKGAYGGRRRDTKAATAAAAVLGVALLLSSWSWLSSRRELSTVQHDLDEFKGKLSSLQQQRYNELSRRRNVENQHHNLNRELQNTIHAIHRIESDMLQEHQESVAISEDCQKKVDEQQDRLAYEQSVSAALKKHLEGMEQSHKTRDADWHHLAEKWKEYEMKAIAENQRLLVENSRLQDKEVPKEFPKPELPLEEPKDRAETHFDTSFHEPEHHHYTRPPEPEQHHDKEHQLDPNDHVHAHEATHHEGERWEHWDHHREKWEDSHGYKHETWEDEAGVLHDSWQDQQGFKHDSWMDDKGVEHNEWVDKRGVRHDDWVDQHGVHHDAWKGAARHEAHAATHVGHGHAHEHEQGHEQGHAQGGHHAVPGWHSGSHEHGGPVQHGGAVHGGPVHGVDEHGRPTWHAPSHQ